MTIARKIDEPAPKEIKLKPIVFEKLFNDEDLSVGPMCTDVSEFEEIIHLFTNSYVKDVMLARRNIGVSSPSDCIVVGYWNDGVVGDE